MVEESGTVEAVPQQQSSFPPDSAPAVVPALIPVEDSNTPQLESDTRPPPVLPGAILIPSSASAPVSSPKPSDLTQLFLYKNHLHEYTQKSRIPLPVYQTFDEGSQGIPKYRSTVVVDEVHYVSPNTFRNRRAAEQDAARIALEYISKKAKDDGFVLLHEDLMLCKSILSEYTVKMSLKRPMYTTKQHEGSVPIFQSTLVFDGVVYTGDISRSKKEAEQLAARAAILSLHDAGNPKSQKTLAEIIASKVRLHAMMQKVKDSHPSQIQPKYMPENTVEHVTTTVNEDKEVNGAILDNVVACGAISEICPTISHLGPELRSIKPVASSPSERLPIESVPSTSEEPVGDRATGTKKRSKNKRKARKKLCMENQVATGRVKLLLAP
ncbi:double-stranded RNA-binding protein 4-like isoform X1 [Cucurbita maxima]|uniref:Double-stranded RNA-binding protein 4-like isoform X1 n=2 Tax=Cucurbita maxima TaxID=3661 RepID=A0A6J1J4E3_CUCMA|nr:double-stranded RNA-binding protein 4-like isoform X1 [Cucurbita maxima]